MNSSKIKQISPSSLVDLMRCPAKYSFKRNVTQGAPMRENSTAQFVGIVVHSCIELLVNEEDIDFEGAWQKAFSQHADGGNSDSEILLRRKKRLLEGRMPELQNFIRDRTRSGSEMIETEKWLTSNDDLLRGQLDLLIVGDAATVLDHKSGEVHHEGVVKEFYENQLAFYSHLVSENYDVERIECWLFSLNEGLVEVSIAKDARKNLVIDTVAAVEEYNRRVPNPQDAKPDDANCSWCDHCSRCAEFWEWVTQESIRKISSGDVILGQVAEGIINATNGKSTFKVNVEKGTKTGMITVQEVPTGLVTRNNLAAGKTVKAVRLSGNEESTILKWNPRNSKLVVEEG